MHYAEFCFNSVQRTALLSQLGQIGPSNLTHVPLGALQHQCCQLAQPSYLKQRGPTPPLISSDAAKVMQLGWPRFFSKMVPRHLTEEMGPIGL
jgi:hypothetical protein